MAELKPPRLRPGDTIGVVSTSWGGAGLLAARFERGVAALEALGFRVKVMPNARAVSDSGRGWVAGSVADRVADLHDAFRDPEIRCVLSAIGGNHSAELLEHLDYELLAAHPKLFCGYSDTTSLLLGLHARTGLVTAYGPALLPEFGEIGGPDREVVEQFVRVTGGAEPAGPLPRAGWQATEDRATTDGEGRPRVRGEPEPRVVVRGGSARGRLLVGCLPTLRSLIGTPWEPDWQGAILVVEPPETPYDAAWADADLIHLRNAGVLAAVAGLGLGRTDGWSERERTLFRGRALAVAGGYDFPILAGLECSHAAPLLALPIGVEAELAGEELTVLEQAVLE